MKLTAEQALQLSIEKWEGIVKDGRVPDKIRDMGLLHHCGLCEKYKLNGDENHDHCLRCPIASEDRANNFGCGGEDHPYRIWSRNDSKRNAQAVLDLLRSKL